MTAVESEQDPGVVTKDECNATPEGQCEKLDFTI